MVGSRGGLGVIGVWACVVVGCSHAESYAPTLDDTGGAGGSTLPISTDGGGGDSTPGNPFGGAPATGGSGGSPSSTGGATGTGGATATGGVTGAGGASGGGGTGGTAVDAGTNHDAISRSDARADAGSSTDARVDTSGARDAAVVTPACVGKVHHLAATDTLIADFEASGLTNWYEYHDASAGTESPLALASPGAANTAHAAHLVATGFTGFGAGLGLGLGCWDASPFTGIAFWAKGTAGPTNVIALQVAIPATHAVADGGDCTTKCYDHPSMHVALSSAWQRFQVPFDQLEQAGFGAPATYQGMIMALNWVSLAGPDVDFQIDQISFY
ncbi:MAG TPA: carbohydrate binding domain-containing protein [Polyangia bacterium]|nr:carbohydrate binding domain-containing protein [Polyangia bacterium]